MQNSKINPTLESGSNTRKILRKEFWKEIFQETRDKFHKKPVGIKESWKIHKKESGKELLKAWKNSGKNPEKKNLLFE